MDDLISRQAAIDALMEILDRPNHADFLYTDEICKALKTLPSAQSEQQWIPCKERLPKPVAPSQRREWFITSNTYGGVTVTCYEFEASPFKEGWQTDMTILAWMPLPEPWKGEDDANHSQI